jgi:hypothetical protein
MTVIEGLGNGPFKNEAAFKAAALKALSTFESRYTRFEIENEEKEPGMPDMLSVSRTRPAIFTEFKCSDKNGVITFQKTQPLFYRKHTDLYITILAWDVPRGRVVSIKPQEVIEARSLKIVIPEDIDVA